MKNDSVRMATVKKDLEDLKRRLGVRSLRPLTQHRADVFVHLVKSLGPGQYSDVLIETKTGHNLDFSWWHADVYCRGVKVATVSSCTDMPRETVKWFDYNVWLHVYIRRVLVEAHKKIILDEAIKAAEDKLLTDTERRAQEAALMKVVDSFRSY